MPQRRGDNRTPDMSTNTIFDIPTTAGTFTISLDGAMMIAAFGPWSDTRTVTAAFEMIGLGDDARAWASIVRRYERAGEEFDKAASEKVQPACSLLDHLLAFDDPKIKALSEEVLSLRRHVEQAWKLLSETIEMIRLKLPQDVVA